MCSWLKCWRSLQRVTHGSGSKESTAEETDTVQTSVELQHVFSACPRPRHSGDALCMATLAPWMKSISKAAPPENSVTPSVSPPVVWTVCHLSLAGLRPPQRNMYPLMTRCEPLSVCSDREARPKLLPQRLGAHRGEG